MIALVTGGSASGKSEYAESLMARSGGNKVYIATMHAWDEESKQRIRKHQAQRADKQFLTVECCTGLHHLILGDIKSDRELSAGVDFFVLLECVSNLVANEVYEIGGTADEVVERILKGVLHLERQTQKLVIVTNEVFSDGGRYSDETREYQRILGRVNQRLAALANEVTEVVYGIPVTIKE